MMIVANSAIIYSKFTSIPLKHCHFIAKVTLLQALLTPRVGFWFCSGAPCGIVHRMLSKSQKVDWRVRKTGFSFVDINKGERLFKVRRGRAWQLSPPALPPVSIPLAILLFPSVVTAFVLEVFVILWATEEYPMQALAKKPKNLFKRIRVPFQARLAIHLFNQPGPAVAVTFANVSCFC
jgi:hypothetical protein